MTEQEAIKIIKIEKECVSRDCDRNCGSCDLVMRSEDIVSAYVTAISALKEIQQYRAIGTIEECREAREKQNAKRPVKTDVEGYRYTDAYKCPSCGGNFSGTGIADYCYHCGQALDWSE